MSAVGVLVGPGDIGEGVACQPIRAAAPIAETNGAFAKGIPRRGGHASLGPVDEPFLDGTGGHLVVLGEAALTSQPLESTSQHRDAARRAALGPKVFFVGIEVSRQADVRMASRVSLLTCHHARADEFSAALHLGQHRSGRDPMLACRCNLDDLTVPVAIPRYIKPRATANAQLAVFAVDHPTRAEFPVTKQPPGHALCMIVAMTRRCRRRRISRRAW